MASKQLLGVVTSLTLLSTVACVMQRAASTTRTARAVQLRADRWCWCQSRARRPAWAVPATARRPARCPTASPRSTPAATSWANFRADTNLEFVDCGTIVPDVPK
jgi:hypothetical protein